MAHSVKVDAEGVVYTTVSDGAVLLNTRTNVYYSLNPVGADIWKNLLQDRQEGAIIADLVARYDVAEERATQDFHSLIEKLEKAGLVICDEGAR